MRGAGTDVIKGRGVEQMHGCTYSIIPDQSEAGSYMVAAAATGGDVLVKNVTPKHLEPITAKLRRAGIEVEEFDDAVRWSTLGTRSTFATAPSPTRTKNDVNAPNQSGLSLRILMKSWWIRKPGLKELTALAIDFLTEKARENSPG